MSSDAADTVALFASIYTETYCDFASSVLYLYDVFIMFDREVAYFWTSKPSGASLLYFANEWINIVYFITLFIEQATFSSDKATFALIVLQFVPPAVFSALRAYVLTRSRLLGLFVLALSMSPAAANLVQYGYQLSGENDPPFGCIETDNVTPAISFKFVFIIVARVPIIVADVILIYITWAKLNARDGLSGIRLHRRPSLSDALFRNGIVLFILNVLHLAFSVTAVSHICSLCSLIPNLIVVFSVRLRQRRRDITAILVSRFLLELQEANQADIEIDRDDPSHPSRDPYDAPSFISSLGAFIDPDRQASSDEDEDDFGSHVASRAGEEKVRVQAAEAAAETSSAAA
ncbi:hypothetical protein OH76DRAFT_1408403 [Lentinus brumalis]|uniref:DUF6533 domain-containing protein n=1 Tax=Lentinus brumalis TaxID=2498619 RepID=A0A371CXZ5_9APHY|nr:hypothetical protein OH76DRAFT_1408403 [Polyporus brumalis]